MTSDASGPLTLEALPPELILVIAAKCNRSTWQIDVNCLARTNRYLYQCLNEYLYRRNHRVHQYVPGFNVARSMGNPTRRAQNWALRKNRLSTFVRSYELGLRIDEPQRMLVSAVEKGHTAIVEYLLSTRDVDINERDPDGFSVLFCAVEAVSRFKSPKQIEVVELLVSRGAEVDAIDLGIGKLAMGEACKTGNIGLVKLLLAHGANVDPPLEQTVNTRSKIASESRGYGPLHLAAAGNHIEVIRLLLDHGANTEAAFCNSTYTPLSVAARAGHVAATRLLLRAGAKARPSGTGPAPLYHAVSNGNVQIHNEVWLNEKRSFIRSSCVLALLEAGADPNSFGLLDFSISHGFYDIAYSLVKYGANLDGKEPWWLCDVVNTTQNCSKLIKILASKGFDCTKCDPDSGMAPLHFAARRANVPALQALLQVGVDIEQKGPYQQTALHQSIIATAESPYKTRSTNLLLKRGANPLAKSVSGATPLHAAASIGDAATMTLLLESDMFGSNLSPLDNLGRTPIFYAASKGHHEVLSLLLKIGRSAECAELRGLRPEFQPCNNLEDADGITPLIAAARGKHAKTVRILLKANPTEFDAKDPQGRGLLELCPNAKLEHLVKSLGAR